MTDKREMLTLKCPICGSVAVEYTKDHLVDEQYSVTFWCPEFHCKVSKITFSTWETGRFADRIKEIKR